MWPRFIETSLRCDGACQWYLSEDQNRDTLFINPACFLGLVDSLFEWPE